MTRLIARIKKWRAAKERRERSRRRREILQQVCLLERELIDLYGKDSERTVIAVQQRGGFLEFYSTPEYLRIDDFMAAIGYSRLRRLAELGEIEEQQTK